MIKLQRKTQKMKKDWSISKLTTMQKGVFVLALAGALSLGLIVVPNASADRFDEQIKELEQESAGFEEKVDDLQSTAVSYQDAISKLQTQIAQVQNEINKNQAKQDQLKQKIKETQIELRKQKKVLGAHIKAMYVDNTMSTIEMLATSKDLSDFIDKEAYRNAAQRQVQDTLKKITKLQSDLKAQKEKVDDLLLAQKAQRSDLDTKRTKQANLLAYNQAQQTDFNSEVKKNSKRIADLRRQQAEENCRIFGCGGGIAGGGGYPWGNARCIHSGYSDNNCPNYDWGLNGSAYNPSTGGWGYRNCTDWVAYRSGGRVPDASVINAYGGSGNAKYWDDAARNMGKKVGSSPSRGDTAVSNGGYYGHVMYVEAVHGDGSITISDYNRAGTGKYDSSTLKKVGDGVYETPTGWNYNLTFVTW